MVLAMTLDTLDNLDDTIKPLYIEKDGKFHLDVDGHDKNDTGDRIPKARLDQEIEKRKASDASLKEIADGFVENVPEDMRDIIPDLPPAAKIKWIQSAQKKGLFDPKPTDGIDTKRPGGKAPENFRGMDPRAIMATGYKTK
ncbi:hypothetical protein DSCW_12850 [Desulfosarcina widdelii]|uniref:Uncharacterized protein n=1 Tax=Desulfosarcina widdelii TaxID=947919 RepID=A0A5K7YZ27_9BACT|nr:hypothetical protein [Desulfosarcina widdelii]BBO73868.1 hypothetical protein DSCW_12850 [Desulfosarcina widdelii]